MQLKKRVLMIFMACFLVMTACNHNDESRNVQNNSVSNENAEQAVENKTNMEVVRDWPEGINFEPEDLNASFDPEKSITIELNDTQAIINGNGAEQYDEQIRITEGGEYILRGKSEHFRMVIDVPKDEQVHIILDDVTMYSSTTSPLYIKEAGKVILTLQEGTSNVFSDEKRSNTLDEDEPNAVIYSKTDLTINGTGALTILARENDGITSRDDLNIVSGSIEVHAVDDGLFGRDRLAIQDGNVTIQAGGDGLKSTNDSEPNLGDIVIEGGHFQIATTGDGMQAAGSIRVDGGTFTINAAEDALNSQHHILLSDGTLNIATNKNGIQADAAIAVKQGEINIMESNEGLEGEQITISGGTLNINAMDDGINITSSDHKLLITGGDIYIDAKGDGLDSNGSIEMSGGRVMIQGPSDDDNGALDYDHIFHMNGGELIAIGSAKMASVPSTSSVQPSILLNYNQNQDVETAIQLKNSQDELIASFVAIKRFQTIVISVEALELGEQYTFYANNMEIASFELSELITVVDSSNN